ncbi:MAG: exodeoxyribonuclease VII large subunit [Oscillospiraceae bacterium]|nr:exodeoxyribonuclease VII large subunit [Oscillospiraceae bacterium]
MSNTAITVKQLNFYVKSLLEGDVKLANICVTGEISNFKNHYSSGHWYFTLKDADAAIRCVMFRGSAIKVKFEPKDGMKVILRGRVSIYEKDGQYQFYAESMTVDGLGDIAVLFEQIKEKLAKEGLFDLESKRPLPAFPSRIAVITSATGAAVQDILNILNRRNPLCEVVLCPVSVQGELAVPEMLNALDDVYSLSNIDLIIIGRGGGSIEDLWAFNDEKLARKIYESPIPVISAVGHETDFTICDFVADLRAPTPSAAAEIAVRDFGEISSVIETSKEMLKKALISRYNLEEERLDRLLNSRVFLSPDILFREKIITLDRYAEKLKLLIEKALGEKRSQFEKCVASIDAMSPLKIMARGYSVVQNKNKTVTSVKNLSVNDEVDLIFTDGKAKAKII